jgi:putative ABC transport system substrate-binding protein
MIDRRTFLAGTGAVLLAAPLAAEAQQAGKVWRIGILGTASTPEDLTLRKAFLQGLRERGYVEGQNLVIERRYSEGSAEQFADFAVELVRLKVDVIVAPGTQAAKAAKQASDTIPIVMVTVGDPVGTGLVASLARPGGNVTGASAQTAELGAKQLELLHEIAPSASRIAVMWDPSNQTHLAKLKFVETAGRALKIEVQAYPVRTPGDLELALGTITRERAMGLLPFDGQVTWVHRRRLVEFSARNRLPTIYSWRGYVNEGGLMCYGPSYADLFRQAAVYVDKILKGAKPADLPVTQPTKFDFAINLKTAKALGLTIPPSLLQRADQVIE